jgi:hypothetical protein
VFIGRFVVSGTNSGTNCTDPPFRQHAGRGADHPIRLPRCRALVAPLGPQGMSAAAVVAPATPPGPLRRRGQNAAGGTTVPGPHLVPAWRRVRLAVRGDIRLEASDQDLPSDSTGPRQRGTS